MSGDREILRAYHEVLVNLRIVDSLLAALVKRIFFVILQAVREAHTECKMARGVLVEQRIVEEYSRISDRGIVGDKRAFAEVCRAFVHGDHLLQKFFAALCLHFDGASALKSDREILNQLAAVRKRLRGVDYSLRFSALRRCEHLLRRNVRIEVISASESVLTAAAEECVRDHADLKVGAVRRFVFEALDSE